ncbi:MAG: phosphatidylserine decarboxylase [Bacteroidota bacterium]|nr:phosphatidylserine decarboxylase [Bacteroidota bacterium]
MKQPTNNSLTGKIADILGLNKKFHQYKETNIDPQDKALISPVEGKVVHIGNINNDGIIFSKHNKEVRLKELIGDYYKQFIGWKYINIYLSPLNDHYWVTPDDGKFIYTQRNKGKAIIPIYLGLENFFNIEMFSKAVKKNATIGSVFQTDKFPIAMIAVGSLNVNRIYTDYEEQKKYKKGIPCGYFSIGSTMLLCFPNDLKILVEKGADVKIGQRILL